MVHLKNVDKVIGERRTPPQWSNLPTDLLLKITDDFNLADQIRFRSVCKNWLSLPLLDNRAIYSLLPWLVIGDDDLRELKRQIIYSRLFDFVNKGPFFYFEKCFGVETSMHGWVISTKNDWYKLESTFIFSCPFSKETVTLPVFHHANLERKLSVSTYPTSRECVFCILFDDGNGKIKVATYKHGYENWITSALHSGISILPMAHIVFFQGDLYCFDCEQMRLFVYNVVQQDWNNSFHTLEPQNRCTDYYLVESAGELLLIFSNSIIHWWVIYVFDATSVSGWVVKTSLLGRALFIGHRWISVPASGEFKHMENKIFYCDRFEEKSKFYDLRDCQSYDCEGTEYNIFARNYGWND